MAKKYKIAGRAIATIIPTAVSQIVPVVCPINTSATPGALGIQPISNDAKLEISAPAEKLLLSCHGLVPGLTAEHDPHCPTAHSKSKETGSENKRKHMIVRQNIHRDEIGDKEKIPDCHGSEVPGRY